MRKDYYHNDAEKIKVKGLDDAKYVKTEHKKYYTGNTLSLNKKEDSYGTFDDGLMF